MAKEPERINVGGSPSRNLEKLPDPGLHQIISFTKSGIRIIGCFIAMLTCSMPILAGSLLLAELVGVVEELV